MALLDDASKDVLWKEVLKDVQDLLIATFAALECIL